MKRKYNHPSMQVIDLYEENDILEMSISEEEVDTSGEDFEQRTDKKNFWDRDGIWK